MVLLFSIEFLTPLILEGCFHLECGFIGPEGNFCKMRGKPGILVCSLYPFWIMDFDWGVLCPAILVTGNWGVVGTGHVRVKGSCSARLSRTLHKSKRRETMSGLLLDFYLNMFLNPKTESSFFILIFMISQTQINSRCSCMSSSPKC